MLLAASGGTSEEPVFKEAHKKVLQLIQRANDIYNSACRSHCFNSQSPVRFEFIMMSHDLLEDEHIVSCPIGNTVDIMDSLVVAWSKHDVYDMLRLHDLTFPPLLKVASMSSEEIKDNYTAEMKTMLVYCAEVVENILDTGRTFWHGIHRKLYLDVGNNQFLGRIHLPFAERTDLTQDQEAISLLPYGINPRLLPSCAPCNSSFKADPSVSHPGHYTTLAYDEARKRGLKFKQLFVEAMRDLILIKYVCCYPGEIVTITNSEQEYLEMPGAMVNLDFRNWATKSAATKRSALKAMVEIFLRTYRTEFHSMVRTKFLKYMSPGERDRWKSEMKTAQEYFATAQQCNPQLQAKMKEGETLSTRGEFF